MDYDFFSDYLEFSGGGETPATYSRWCCLGMLGAWMGRQVYFRFGSQRLHCNQYIMLLGSAGTKKSTAINTAKKLIKAAGYDSIAAEKTSKEKFLLDLSEDKSGTSGNALDEALWGETSESDVREVWICKGEFNDFFAANILEFVSTLGDLWDFEGPYDSKIKHGVSPTIPNPTISILGGNTQTTFAGTFPPEAMGQGFLSRVIAVYAKPTGVRVTWPKIPEERDIERLISKMVEMKERCLGEMTCNATTRNLVDKIYKNWKPIPDIRFENYGNRRLTHLLKLAMIHAVSRCSMEITELDIIRANTVLHHAEQYMPDAYGDFGMSRNSPQIHKIMRVIEENPGLTTGELWAKMQSDFDKIDNFVTVMSGMNHAGKVQSYQERIYPIKRVVEEVRNDILDYDYLSAGEKI